MKGAPGYLLSSTIPGIEGYITQYTESGYTTQYTESGYTTQYTEPIYAKNMIIQRFHN